MQSPTIIFDHINKVTTLSGVDPTAAQKLAETLDKIPASASGGQPATR